MDRPGPSHQVDKVEIFELREHVPSQAELTRAPTTYDEESGIIDYSSTWDFAWKAICQLYNMFHHMLIAIVVFCLWDYALRGTENGAITGLQLHIVFAGTGYMLFLTEAVLTLHRHNAWSIQLSPDSKRIVHGCLQLIGSLFVIAGTFLALTETNMVVYSAHGICGIIAFSFTVISLFSGIITLFSSKVRLMVKSNPIKILHIAVGLIAITGGLLSLVLGFNMEYFRADRQGLATALMTFVVLILGYVIVQPVIDLISTVKMVL